MNPFDYIDTITTTKKNIMVDEVSEKGYVPFIVNRGLSQYAETILFANEINKCSHLDNRLQYEMLLNIVRPKKMSRRKWGKFEASNNLEVVMEYYKCNSRRAQEYLSMLPDDELKKIKKRLEKGGKR
jgi:hypothetical protein